MTKDERELLYTDSSEQFARDARQRGLTVQEFQLAHDGKGCDLVVEGKKLMHKRDWLANLPGKREELRLLHLELSDAVPGLVYEIERLRELIPHGSTCEVRYEGNGTCDCKRWEKS